MTMVNVGCVCIFLWINVYNMIMLLVLIVWNLIIMMNLKNLIIMYTLPWHFQNFPRGNFSSLLLQMRILCLWLLGFEESLLSNHHCCLTKGVQYMLPQPSPNCISFTLVFYVVANRRWLGWCVSAAQFSPRLWSCPGCYWPVYPGSKANDLPEVWKSEWVLTSPTPHSFRSPPSDVIP